MKYVTAKWILNIRKYIYAIEFLLIESFNLSYWSLFKQHKDYFQSTGKAQTNIYTCFVKLYAV